MASAIIKLYYVLGQRPRKYYSCIPSSAYRLRMEYNAKKIVCCLSTNTPRFLFTVFQQFVNSSPPYQKKIKCSGNAILLVDEKGKKKRKTCICCGGQNMLVYCTICHHNFCFDANTKSMKKAASNATNKDTEETMVQ